jgi:hypothetical protein
MNMLDMNILEMNMLGVNESDMYTRHEHISTNHLIPEACSAGNIKYYCNS